jgi:hypothetical protein
LWANLSEDQRALAWKYADHEDKQAIADITDVDLNELAARARRLPDEGSVSSPDDERESIDENGIARFELERIHRERIETELNAIRGNFSVVSQSPLEFSSNWLP